MSASSSHPISTRSQSNTVSNIAGIGGGTLFLTLVQNLPDTSPYKSWLIILAPAISVCLAWLWKLAVKEYEKYAKKRTIKKLKKKLDQDIELALVNPDIPLEDKDKLKRERIAIDLENISNIAQKIKSIQSDE